MRTSSFRKPPFGSTTRPRIIPPEELSPVVEVDCALTIPEAAQPRRRSARNHSSLGVSLGCIGPKNQKLSKAHASFPDRQAVRRHRAFAALAKNRKAHK